MKVEAKDLYRKLKGELDAPMAACGYLPDKVAGAAWCKPGGERSIRVWFQIDKDGWDDEWGSTFTVHFETENQAECEGGGEIASFERIGYLLEGFSELDELRKINNAVIEALPGTLEGGAEFTTLDDGSIFPIIGHVVDPEPAIAGRDIWLHYGSIGDVEMWAKYFGQHLPRFCEMYENGERSPLGEARTRYNEVMAKVQNETELSRKVLHLEEYIKNEQDAGYVEAAQKLVNEFNQR